MATSSPRARLRRRRGSSFLVVVSAVLCLLVAYTGDRLIPDAWPLWAEAAAWLAVASVVFVALMVLFAGGGELFSKALAPVGLFVLVLTFTVFRDLAWLVAWIAHVLP